MANDTKSKIIDTYYKRYIDIGDCVHEFLSLLATNLITVNANQLLDLQT